MTSLLAPRARLAACIALAFVLTGADSRALLAPGMAPAPSPLALDPILYTNNPAVEYWSTVFRRAYGLSVSLAQRTDAITGDVSDISERAFLVANAALSAAAAMNIQAAINASAPEALMAKVVAYSRSAGSQTLRVTQEPAAQLPSLFNLTAAAQMAGESAIEAADAAVQTNFMAAMAAAENAAEAAEEARQEARKTIPLGTAPNDRPY